MNSKYPTTAARSLLLAGLLVTTGYLFVRTAAQERRSPVTPGRQANGDVLVTTNQAVTPIGKVVETTGARPKDLALSPDGKTLAVLTNKQKQGVLIYSAETGEPEGEAPLGSLTPDALGLVWSPDGKALYASCQKGAIARITHSDAAGWKEDAEFQIGGSGDPQVLGLAISPDQSKLYAALGKRNSVAELSLPDGKLLRTLPVGVAPYRLLISQDGAALYAANRGGRLLGEDKDPSEPSGGTRVRVDPETDAALQGSLSIIDLKRAEPAGEEVNVGRQPSHIVSTPDGSTLYVACADSDTIEVLDVRSRKIVQSIALTPQEDPGFGQIPTMLALSEDGNTLYAACGGENAIAVISTGAAPRITGYLPTGWFPIALAERHGRLYVASSKGIGPRTQDPRNKSYYVHNSIGTVQFIAESDRRDLAAQSRQVARNNLWGRELEPRVGRPAAPIPERVGEPSVFKHIVYIIKENQTYDSLLGDMPEGNGDKALNLYGEQVCPNHHQLARDFVLLDNTYTSGTNSADGHQWCNEAVANGYMEQNYDAHLRSYPYDGGDPLAYSPNGFLWTAALRKHLTVRVYGEFVNKPEVRANGPGVAGTERTWTNLWKDRSEKTDKFTINAATDNKALAPYLNPHCIGFPLTVSDQWRADQFVKDLADFEVAGSMPNLSILLLPCDHTSGTRAGMPTPSAEVADNDLALGRVVEGLSKSKFWKETLILVIEDDSQAAVDHVDGHRTAAFCISPYTRRKAVVSEYYNHTSLLRTMELVLGLPAMTRFDRTATPMAACFTQTPDFSPYQHAPNRTPLDDINRPAAQLKGEARRLALQCNSLDWSDLDRADPNIVARADWHSRKPDTPFPSSLYTAPEPDGD